MVMHVYNMNLMLLAVVHCCEENLPEDCLA